MPTFTDRSGPGKTNYMLSRLAIKYNEMKRLLILLFVTTSFLSFITAQPNFPENGELYIDTTVPRIDILIDPDTLAWLYQPENLESDVEFHAVFIFDNGNVRAGMNSPLAEDNAQLLLNVVRWLTGVL